VTSALWPRIPRPKPKLPEAQFDPVSSPRGDLIRPDGSRLTSHTEVTSSFGFALDNLPMAERSGLRRDRSPLWRYLELSGSFEHTPLQTSRHWRLTPKIELLLGPSSKPRQAGIPNTLGDAPYVGNLAAFYLADEI
jgi:hypothetical protein